MPKNKVITAAQVKEALASTDRIPPHELPSTFERLNSANSFRSKPIPLDEMRSKDHKPLETFLQFQIKRLQSCFFTKGVKDKVALFKQILEEVQERTQQKADKFKNVYSEAEFGDLYSHIAMVAHHRRSRCSHLFFKGPSRSWQQWQAYCNEQGIVGKTSERPTILLGSKTVSSYNEYRKNQLSQNKVLH